MTSNDPKGKYSTKAKIIFILIPVIIFIFIEILLRLFFLVKENRDLNNTKAVPALVSTPVSQLLDRQTLLANYENLNQPVGQLPFFQSDNDLGICLKPNSSFTFMNPESNTVINYSINSLGFRGEEISIEKPKNKVRIICAGDSSTFGYFLNLINTYPQNLGMLLSKATKEKNAEVINAGTPTYNSTGGVIYFEKKLRMLHPDILIFSYGFNDSFFKTRPVEKTSKIAKLADFMLENGFSKLAIYKALDKFIKKLRPEKGFDKNLGPVVRPDEFRDNLEKIILIIDLAPLIC